MSRGPLHALPPVFHEKIWGSEQTAPWFPSAIKKVGEVWFQSPEVALPLLVKFIFTSERLSVQVHPDDAYAQAVEGSPGKTEMWHILRAEPGAAVAVGLKSAVSREELRQSALSGEIEHRLRWIAVHPGDSILVPAGTVHAIGGGLALCEIQEVSDVTYRLYDYGRPRELHLEKALQVAFPGPHPGLSAPEILSPTEARLAACSHFVTDRIAVDAPDALPLHPERAQIWVALEGCGQVGDLAFRPGSAWLTDPGAGALLVVPDGSCRLLRTRLP